MTAYVLHSQDYFVRILYKPIKNCDSYTIIMPNV